MSYEGYTQNICEKGHLFNAGCFTDPICHCGSANVQWSNDVDETNGDSVGIILDFSPCLISEEKRETCNLGHSHIIHEAIYRVPKKKELQRFYRDYRSGELIPFHFGYD